MGLDLKDALRMVPAFHNTTTNKLDIPRAHFSPGFLAVLSAYINNRGLAEEQCTLPGDGYLQAIGIHAALWGQDRYEQPRINVGTNYSLITPLRSVEAVDDATSTINSCIRRLVFPERESYPDGVNDLMHVVGELHDNVWSHGRSTGFSLAQKSAVPYTGRQQHFLEFALADCGMGFLSELRRANIRDIVTHKDAIQWCIQQGNSSKHADQQDDWAQQLPYDHIGGNVFGHGVAVRESQNNHQGLGLAHLMSLVATYNGTLLIASGDTCLSAQGDVVTYEQLQTDWKGVAISCRFILSDLATEHDETSDPELADIMRQLGES